MWMASLSISHLKIKKLLQLALTREALKLLRLETLLLPDLVDCLQVVSGDSQAWVDSLECQEWAVCQGCLVWVEWVECLLQT